MTNLEITDKLEKLPSLIASKCHEVEKAHSTWKLKELALKSNEAKLLLEEKAKNPSVKVHELKAMVESNNDLFVSRMSVLGNETEFKKKEIELQQLDNEFTGLKVIARIRIAEMSSMLEVK